MNAKITCDVGDDRCRIATARLEKDIFVRTHLHTSPIVVKIRAMPHTRAAKCWYIFRRVNRVVVVSISRFIHSHIGYSHLYASCPHKTQLTVLRERLVDCIYYYV